MVDFWWNRSRRWKMEGLWTPPSTVYLGQLHETFNCTGSGVLSVIHHIPAQRLKIGQMNHTLKVPISADYKGSLGWQALLEMSALWIHEVRWEKSLISHCFISYLEKSLFKIKGWSRLRGYLILHWAAQINDSGQLRGNFCRVVCKVEVDFETGLFYFSAVDKNPAEISELN